MNKRTKYPEFIIWFSSVMMVSLCIALNLLVVKPLLVEINFALDGFEFYFFLAFVFFNLLFYFLKGRYKKVIEKLDNKKRVIKILFTTISFCYWIVSFALVFLLPK